MYRSRNARLTAMLFAVLAFAVLQSASAQAQSSNLIQGGDFEQPAYFGITVFYAGDSFGNWHVSDGSVDLVADRYWQPEEGHQALDLSGDTAGTLYQDVPATVNQTYQLSFYLAGNTYDQPDIKSLNVLVNNAIVGHFTFDTTHTSALHMGWRLTQLTFTATSSVTRITFQSLNNQPNGPVLDNISLVPVTGTSTADTCLLWTNTNGMASTWNVSAGGAYRYHLYGPYDGWDARSLAQGSDGAARLLWTHDGGLAALWNLADPQPDQTCLVYGPFDGWAATAFSAGHDNIPHILWTHPSGLVSLWTVAADGTYSYQTYGPYDGWTVHAIPAGPDNQVHLLWTHAGGLASLWNLADANPDHTCYLYGPFDGWTATGLSVGSDNLPRLLWTHTSGLASTWAVNADGTYTYRMYGPYDGWSATGISVGTDNDAHLLWTHAGGISSLWSLADPQPDQTCDVYGSFAGWTATSLAAGP